MAMKSRNNYAQWTLDFYHYWWNIYRYSISFFMARNALTKKITIEIANTIYALDSILSACIYSSVISASFFLRSVIRFTPFRFPLLVLLDQLFLQLVCHASYDLKKILIHSSLDKPNHSDIWAASQQSNGILPCILLFIVVTEHPNILAQSLYDFFLSVSFPFNLLISIIFTFFFLAHHASFYM